MNLVVTRETLLEFNGRSYRCAIGKNGFSTHKREGDLCTPIGSFALRRCLYRKDKLAPPQGWLSLQAISFDDGWCDAPNDPAYNTFVKLPYSASHERLWRDDDVYDLIVPLGYNDDPILPGMGSAIFMHVATPDYTPTEGCVALAKADLLEILQLVTPESRIEMHPDPDRHLLLTD